MIFANAMKITAVCKGKLMDSAAAVVGKRQESNCMNIFAELRYPLHGLLWRDGWLYFCRVGVWKWLNISSYFFTSW